jgi:hypothetical protein
MLETKKLFATGLALALLATTGCYDFDTSFTECVRLGRCNPPPGTCNPALPDLPDEDFVDANCDGVDGDADAGFFVDPTAGSNVNPGTLKAPFRSLAHALPIAADAGKVLYLAQGPYNEPALRLERPVSLYGGYARGEDGGWARGNAFETRINGGPIGLTVSGLEDTALTLEQLHIISTTPPDAGAPSIGLRVLNSMDVRLRHVTVEAGRGADGLPSNPAVANPQAGADGGPGQTPTDTPTDARADGGSPGVNSCGTGIRGGSGGQGGIASATATPGEAGIPSADGGELGQNVTVGDCSGTLCQCNGDAGGRGQDGAEGNAGTDGPAGDGIGQQKNDSWVANAGGGGGPGQPGGGGGGGGGGGYCLVQAGSRLLDSKGGGGGGGGAGGCPGVGAGAGGGGGGASIAVLLVNGRVDLVSSTLKTAGGGQGGAGGRGSDGGPGGKGGLGGAGNPRVQEHTSGTTTYRLEATGGPGGNGGNGGNGGRGGHGGNGGGGPSVGIWCGSDSSFTQRGTVFDLGDGGLPGNGPNPRGESGIKEEQYGCQ